jgi:putative hydrolase of the HAD superfamily
MIASNSVFVFDLDDTLYKERDFVLSACCAIEGALKAKGVPVEEGLLYRHFLEDGATFLQRAVERHPQWSLGDLLALYRTHTPHITLEEGAKELLDALLERGIPLGLVTDGRSLTQRAKVNALGLEHYFDSMVVSEEVGTTKPHEGNFTHFHQRYPHKEFVYIANDVKKDFLAPRRLGWLTICVRDDGRNIHSQEENTLPGEYLPEIKVDSLRDIIALLPVGLQKHSA